MKFWSNRRKLLRIGCLIIIAPCLLFYLLGYGTFIFNRIKWNSQGISSYTMTLRQSGLCSSSPVNVTVSKGKVTSFSQWGLTQDEHSPYWYPNYWQQYTVDEQFKDALQCKISPFCSVRYNPVRGYPEIIDDRATMGIMDIVTGSITDWCITENLNLAPLP